MNLAVSRTFADLTKLKLGHPQLARASNPMTSTLIREEKLENREIEKEAQVVMQAEVSVEQP